MLPIRDLNPTRITPVFTVLLILASVAAFIWQEDPTSLEGQVFLEERAAIACELTTGDALSEREFQTGVCSDGPETPRHADKNIWFAAVLSMFLHGGLFHLLGNMWFLWVFGNNVEEAYGNLGYLGFYLSAGVIATAAFVLANPDVTEPLVGASGAIAGVLGAYLVLFPRHQVLSLVFVFFVPVPAIIFLGLWFLSQFGIQDISVAWEAHVAGFIFGALVTLPLREFLLTRVAQLHATATFRT